MIEADGQRIYTMSELMRYLECPKLYEWSYGERLRRTNSMALPLNVGSAVHFGIERMLMGSRSALDEALAMYAAETGPHWAMAEEYGKTWQDLVKGREQIKGCLATYPWTAEDFNGIESTEEAFIVEMGAQRCYAGKWDRVVKLPDGRLYIHDTKTTGERLDFVIQKHRMRMQYKAYCYAYWKIHGTKPAGFIMDFIVKPRVNFKKDGSLSSISDTTFHREPMVMRQCDYDYFPTWFERVVDGIERDTATTMFPQNSEACGNWNRLCSYYDLCRAGSSRMEAAIKDSLFDVETEIHGSEYITEASLQAAAWRRRVEEDAAAVAREEADA
jgi:hypothetical protein